MAGLPGGPLRLVHGEGWGLLDEFLYRMYGMYLAVLAARMAASHGDRAGHGDPLFPDQPRPRPRNPFPWNDFVGPLLGDTVRNQPWLRPGAPRGWRWPHTFVQDLVRCPPSKPLRMAPRHARRNRPQ